MDKLQGNAKPKPKKAADGFLFFAFFVGLLGSPLLIALATAFLLMSDVVAYKPSCSLAALKARARLYACVRQFFADRGVLEVETPILSAFAATDAHLRSICATRRMAGKAHTHYLQTSPEFAMKRLLASQTGSIYQICKVFRDDEHGGRHNSEFSMLEWYRVGFSLEDLLRETQDLLCAVFGRDLAFARLSYKSAFAQALGVNPFAASLQDLRDLAACRGVFVELGDDKQAYCDLLFSHCVEPFLAKDTPTFLTDFPAAMASLAKTHIDADGDEVASRFELYIDGLEIANAYDELGDAKTLLARFADDNARRVAMGLLPMPIDKRLLCALDFMPPCAGIALGLDRLLMALLGAKTIAEVVSFCADCA